MGAHVCVEHGYITASSQHLPQGRLQGARYYMDMVTVTGTENLLMSAVLANGTTILENAAREPEVVDLTHCLIAMGANIKGVGTDVITIEGVESLHGTDYCIMGDRIEAATYLVAVAMTGGQVVVQGIQPYLLDAVLEKLRETGVEIATDDSSVTLKSNGNLRSVNIQNRPISCFPDRYAGTVCGVKHHSTRGGKSDGNHI